MGSFFKSEETVRAYLLGRVSDETQLEEIEQLLFTDEEFCSQVELMEDGIINDYVFGRLDQADAESFRATLLTDPERRTRLELTQALREKALARNVKVADEPPSLLASLNAFFRQPKYAGAFAILLIAIVSLTVYFSRRRINQDELAELRSIYQQARPTETRISEFGYAPLAQLRGAPESKEKNRLRRIENILIEATEKTPNAETYHALGVYNLTQRDYRQAIKDFESALKFANQNGRIHNDLGAAYLELSKTEPSEKKLEDLAQSLEEFTKATELDGNLLEALFNKSLALQELGSLRQAKESWNRYLQKDPSSPWAVEARKNLTRIESEQTLHHTDEQVLEAFLSAYRNHDDARAKKIHNETKGLFRGPAVPLQLSRRYLVARQRGSIVEANESIAALASIASFEQDQNGDSFFFELANFYSHLDANSVEGVLHAQDILASGQQSTDPAQAVSQLERSRDLFTRLGDECEAVVAEIWAVQFLPDIGKVAETRLRLTAIIDNAERRKFNVLLPSAYYWLGVADYRQGLFSESAKHLKTALRLAETGENAFEIQHAEHALAVNYSELGELEQALLYAGNLVSRRNLYYQNPSQDWRDKGTLVDIVLKLKFFSTALHLSRERLSMAQENWSTDSRVNDSLRSLIEAAIAKEDFPAALKYAGESMQVALGRGDNVENARKTAEIYRLLADVKRQTKACDEALTDYDQALDLFHRFPEVTEALYQIHKGKLFCFRQLNRQEDFSSELKTVFKLSEEYRSKIREDDSRQAFFASEQDVFDAATANSIAAHDSREAFASVEASKARSLVDFIGSGKSIVEAEKSFGPVAQPLLSAEIQARLPEQVQIVQYAVLPDKLAIWVVSKTRFDLLEKQITAVDLEKKVAAYQALIIDKGLPAEIKKAAQDLYRLLIPSDLAGDKQVCFVPDKSLHQLAFATLVSPDGRYLLQDYALFYAPGASVLVLATENARSKEPSGNERLLSIGNPDFDREENLNLPDLRDAEAEAKAITADYQRSLELLGSEATKEQFLRNLAGAEVIHFAGHFVPNRQSPGNSKLLFARGELRSSELSAYRLPLAKLIVLSACETGFERYNNSEGAIGIARTLLALGAPLVVASEWKVDSEPTKDLMIAFHRNRKEKRMTTAESLRQAQLEMLSRNQTSAPFYWAAFSLFGGYANY